MGKDRQDIKEAMVQDKLANKNLEKLKDLKSYVKDTKK